MGSKQRRYPWEAAILSALSIADEFCLVYDERFDDVEMFTGLDQRIVPIKHSYDFLKWDFINIALTLARSHCNGDWCLRTEMDYVFHDSCAAMYTGAVDLAHTSGKEAVSVPIFYVMQDLVDEPYWSSRQILTRNVPYIIHRTSDRMIGIIDSDIYDGKRLLDGFDDWSLQDLRTNDFFYDMNGVDVLPESKIGSGCVWHYSYYNPGRKTAQGHQTHFWQDRVYGRSLELDEEAQIELLKERIVINSNITKESYEFFLNKGFTKTELLHPSWALEWVASMGIDAT
jgi:hypothetical protein